VLPNGRKTTSGAVDSKQLANKTHYDVGQKVRQTIKDLALCLKHFLPGEKYSATHYRSEK
jgi:DNA-damage-inducible protein D